MAKEKKSEKELKEKKTKVSKKEKKELFAEYPNLWEVRSQDDIDHTMAFAEEYMAFLDTERTLNEAKKNVGVKSFRSNNEWYWKLSRE